MLPPNANGVQRPRLLASVLAALLALVAEGGVAPSRPDTSVSGVMINNTAGTCPRVIAVGDDRDAHGNVRMSERLASVATGMRLTSAKPVEHALRFEGTLRPAFASCEGFGERVLWSVLHTFWIHSGHIWTRLEPSPDVRLIGADVVNGNPVVTGMATH